MERRLLITAAGTGASNNVIRSLKAGDASVFIVGCHHDRFVLKKSTADRNYLIPSPSDPRFLDQLCRLIESESIDLAIPTGDYYVWLFSRLEDEMPCRLFLPPQAVINLCQDKYLLTVFLGDKGVPVPLTYPVNDLTEIEEIFYRLPPRDRVWCRIRTGSGSTGAIPVRNPDQARSWIEYWEEMRRVPASAFTLSEYLPGRDFACQSLWNEGKLILVKTHERLSYFGGEARPSGVSSIPALAKIVFEPRVVEISAAAIRALDEKISGAFEVDLKEDADGNPRITEINAGRLFSGTNLFDFTGKFNMAVTYIRLALGELVEIGEPYDVEEGYYMVRDLDTLPGIFHANELFEGIGEIEG